MTLPLIKKEIRQHKAAVILLMFLSFFSFLIMLLTVASEGNKRELLDILSQFIFFFTVPLAMVTCRRLIIIEYELRTHLFLEALPISRVRLVVTKYLFGLCLMLLSAGGISAASIFFRAVTGHMDGSFIAIVSLRVLLFILFIYNFFFLMAYTGRYRFVIYIILFMSYLFITSQTGFEPGRTGPFALINNTFAYERFKFPLNDALITLVMITLFAALAFGLGLAKEGAIATLFSAKMSHKEKVILAIICCMVGFSMITFNLKKQREPFDLITANQASGDGVSVKIAGSPGKDDYYRDLASFLHEELVVMRKYLAIDTLKPVFIIQDDALLPMVYDRVQLKESDGILLYVNMNHTGFDKINLERNLIMNVLVQHTGVQAAREKNYWVLAGFAEYWIHRKLSNHKKLQMRAVYGLQEQLTPQSPAVWFTLERQCGEAALNAVSLLGIMELFKNYPENQVKAFLQKVLGTKHHQDVRALFTSPGTTAQGAFKKIFKAKYKTFIKDWSAAIEEYRSVLQDEVNKVPRLNTDLIITEITDTSRSAVLSLTVSGGSDTKDKPFYCLYAKLEGIKNGTPFSKMKHFQDSTGSSGTFELPAYYAPGNRIDYIVLMYSDTLGCYIASPAKIKEITK